MMRALLAVAFLTLLAVPAFAVGPAVPSGTSPPSLLASNRVLPAELPSSRAISPGGTGVLGGPTCADADFNGDGHLTASDLAIWLNWYFIVGYVAAGDLDTDGDLDPSDLALWLNLYFIICL